MAEDPYFTARAKYQPGGSHYDIIQEERGLRDEIIVKGALALDEQLRHDSEYKSRHLDIASDDELDEDINYDSQYTGIVHDLERANLRRFGAET